MSVTVAVIGCGNRGGDVYARHLTAQGARVVAIADPRAERLALVGDAAGVPEERRFADWQDLLALGRIADGVVIATPDHEHVAPALAALDLGYHLLLEKPVCLREEELDVLLAAEAGSAGRVTVCHPLRHTPFFREVARLIQEGVIGRLVGAAHLENVAWWHYAHSYVRGNWRSVAQGSGPFILAKAVHDLDVLRWFAGATPVTISCSGDLLHFRPEEAPPGAAERCLDCPVLDCPYDARRIYLGRPPGVWPVSVLTASHDPADLLAALREGPYGRCVYHADNDQPDHLAATIAFANGVRTSLTVSAFTFENTRTLKLLGTRGELRGHMDHGEIEVRPFIGEPTTHHVEAGGNHAGGDDGLVRAWLAFLRGETPTPPTRLAESLDSHRMAFAGERARLSGTVETLTHY